ncbi:MAG: putative transcriptional regulator, GntR family [Blastococcus sp.]|jgi:2-aminoadipate transaminase|nr:putative transcriptional regulator, GntR family [Blastococcus sp.]
MASHGGSWLTGASANSYDWSALFARRTARGGDELTAILSMAAATDVITFSGGFPAPEVFPVDVLSELVERLLKEDAAVALQYSPTEGLPRARAAVATLLEQTQGRGIDPADVLITSGGIEGLQLLARTLIEPGDRVLVEAPTYLGAIMAFSGFEADVEGVAVDADGLRLDALEVALSSGRRPKLLYVIPDHQNPSGLSLSEERRHQLVELCRRHGLLIIEDVAYRELGFEGQAAPSLWSLGPDVVVQLGTFSKILVPGVRLGWAVGPSALVGAMTAAKQNSDQCAGALGQTIMAEYVTAGHLDRTLETARGLYRYRADRMLDALEAHMPEGVSWTRPSGGFFVWLTAPQHVDTRALVAPAARLGVAYVPGAPFYTDTRGGNQIRLSYSRADDASIDEGIRRLATLIRAEL